MRKKIVKILLTAAVMFIVSAYSGTAQCKVLDASVFKNATELPINYELEDAKAYDEVKCYKIRTTGSMQYYYRTFALSLDSPGPVMALYDESFKEITLLETESVGRELDLEPYSTYYIALFSSIKDDSYSIMVYTNTDDCGSTFDTSKTIYLGDNNEDYLDSAWDRDMFRFETDFWDRHTIHFVIKAGDNINGSRRMYVDLYDSERNLIISKEAGGQTRWFDLNVTLEPYSTYYMNVRYVGIYLDAGEKYPYIFSIGPNDFEKPSWANSARELKMNEFIDISLDRNETQYFVFTTPDDDSLFYEIWPIDQEYGSTIMQKLYNSDCEELSKIYYTNKADERRGQVLKPNTTYYVSLTNIYSRTDFKFGVKALADDVTEPKEIMLNKLYTHTLQSYPDIDTFKFTTGPEGHYLASLFVRRGTAVLVARLYDENYNLVDYYLNDRIGHNQKRVTVGSRMKPNATYYLEVSHVRMSALSMESNFELTVYSGISWDAVWELSERFESSCTYSAVQTKSTVLVNGKKVSFDAYNIHDNNYFKLRDLALQLRGTGKQFEVEWDAANQIITLTSGKPYTSVGGEMTKGNPPKDDISVSVTTVCIDGVTYYLNAYKIGGNNYYKLRDIGYIFDFGVDWDGKARSVVIDTTKGYTE